ncbi:adenylyltransferase/sulfurtransferase [Propionibacteriaceae bacterium ES.041]|uniref:molybdopterin-synthase adenylyltransferase MoeB n=1 Tax=Enemella evansiae TaxID=2016499 RepID=UPI000B960C90|nr:molybdopterin-synthase adenylyltransferase MoeB [Enemella evansiae]OYN98885.1 adenylyltransferase/sulfurtransferase MoeZ [Enemella evansiae]PFG67614.1 adenylyltransferase/sulfurtransferase [Propionibacteriaceae bacterium ES.041]
MQTDPLVEPAESLTAEEMRRYARHLTLPEVGVGGQRRLKNARVLVIGAGGLGSPTLLYLAAAGVGTIGVVDFDVVEESNLQRQVLHGVADLGRPKVDSAADAVARLNPLVRLIKHLVRIDTDNALELIGGYDLVIDGTDNFATRYLVNDACALLGKPYVWASILRFDGQISVFWAGHGPCYRCIFPDPPPPGAVPSCAEGGVLGLLCGAIGSAQAAEAVKLLLGAGDPLLGRLQVHDALRASWQQLPVSADPDCPLCGANPRITTLLEDYQDFCGIGRGTPEAGEGDEEGDGMAEEISVEELRDRLAARERGEDHFVLVDVREPVEREISVIPESVLIPKGAFEEDAVDLARLAEAADGGEVLLYCRSGARSGQVQQILLSKEIPALNVTGGVLAWSDRIDPSQPKY